MPGNHDVPLYNIARRAFRPLTRFARYISAAPLPFFADGELAVLGLNTARSAAFSNGRISRDQMAAIRRQFSELDGKAFRVLVAHHPLTPPPHAPDRGIVGRARHALDAVAEAGIELLLTGHYHQAFTGESRVLPSRRTPLDPRLPGRNGDFDPTARRGQFLQLIRIDGREVGCLQRGWTGKDFAARRTQISGTPAGAGR